MRIRCNLSIYAYMCVFYRVPVPHCFHCCNCSCDTVYMLRAVTNQCDAACLNVCYACNNCVLVKYLFLFIVILPIIASSCGVAVIITYGVSISGAVKGAAFTTNTNSSGSGGNRNDNKNKKKNTSQQNVKSKGANKGHNKVNYNNHQEQVVSLDSIQQVIDLVCYGAGDGSEDEEDSRTKG